MEIDGNHDIHEACGLNIQSGQSKNTRSRKCEAVKLCDQRQSL